MALYRCTTGSGGGMTETVLWTNPDSTQSFASQLVSISPYTFSEFDYIKIEWKGSTWPTSLTGHILVPPDVLALDNGSYEIPRAAIGMNPRQDTTGYVRILYSYQNTQLYFGNCSKMGGSGNVNTYAIPLKIVGIKY